jgi:radical SAM protein with 4Fe4S-binding SPASM domain
MNCTNTKSDTSFQKEFSRTFREKLILTRTPVSGSLEITTQCNLKCLHCYNEGNMTEELPASFWKGVIDQIVEEGCLFLLITGGDPLIRPDFLEIYEHARKRGVIVTIFSNGTLINKDHLKLFKELPPALIEITLYGIKEETYEKITGVKGSFKMCMEGIDMLTEAGLHIRLKTVILQENMEEFQEIRKFARNRDIDFRSDPAIFPRLNGDPEPMNHRVEAERAVAQELSDPEVLRKWKDYTAKHPDTQGMKKLYNCGAGKIAFHISPSGILQPCLMTDNISYDLKRGYFRNGWKKVIPGISEIEAPKGLKCRDCDRAVFCGYCPAFLELENGTELRHSDYLCKIGEYRLKYLKEGVS